MRGIPIGWIKPFAAGPVEYFYGGGTPGKDNAVATDIGIKGNSSLDAIGNKPPIPSAGRKGFGKRA